MAQLRGGEPTEGMNLEFEPVAGTHAIEACTLTIRFFQPVAGEAMAEIAKTIEKVASDNGLPGKQQIAQPALVFGFENFGAPPPSFGFISYQRYAPDGKVVAELKCEAAAISLTVREYMGWASLIDFAERTLIEVAKAYLKVAIALTGVTLQYEDRFTSDPGDKSTAAVFRPKSRWINSSFVDVPQPWHSHFGLFLPKGVADRELVNVNVTVSDVHMLPLGDLKRSVALMILVGHLFDVVGEAPLSFDENCDLSAELRSLIDGVHVRQRAIFNEIISDDYLIAVGAKK